MKRSGRLGSMVGSRREMCRMLVVEFGAGGWYWPDSRKGLMFDMRRREEAEGDRRMMGSGRREDFLGWEGRPEGTEEWVVEGRAEVAEAAAGGFGRARLLLAR